MSLRIYVTETTLWATWIKSWPPENNSLEVRLHNGIISAGWWKRQLSRHLFQRRVCTKFGRSEWGRHHRVPGWEAEGVHSLAKWHFLHVKARLLQVFAVPWTRLTYTTCRRSSGISQMKFSRVLTLRSRRWFSRPHHGSIWNISTRHHQFHVPKRQVAEEDDN